MTTQRKASDHDQKLSVTLVSYYDVRGIPRCKFSSLCRQTAIPFLNSPPTMWRYQYHGAKGT